MFFFLSKTLTFLFMPMGLLTITLLFALFTKNRARQRRALIAAAVLLFLAGNSFLVNELARWWEVPPTGLPARAQPRVGVVLTGGLMKTNEQLRNYLYLGDQGDRVGQALLLYKTGRIQKILISGGSGSLIGAVKYTGGDEGQMARRFLTLMGVPARDIVLENKSVNTHENARLSAPILRRDFSGYEVVLITSGWHMRRAIGCFEKQNVAVTPYPAAIMAGAREYSPGILLLPSEKALQDGYWLVHELVGYVTYRVVGYL